MNIKKLMILLAGLFILASCSRPLEDRIERFVNKTEANYETYSEEDWQKSLNEYQALTQEYKDNYQSFSKEERDRIYAGILLKKGISSAGNVLQEAIDGASSFLKGVLESAESEE